jgi:hypothetical protein
MNQTRGALFTIFIPIGDRVSCDASFLLSFLLFSGLLSSFSGISRLSSLIRLFFLEVTIKLTAGMFLYYPPESFIFCTLLCSYQALNLLLDKDGYIGIFIIFAQINISAT